jgi:type III secretion protein T
MNDFPVIFHQVLITVVLCTPRILAAFIVAPFFNTRLITGVTRNAVAFSFALIVFPILFPSVGERSFSILAFLGIIAKESILGTAFGFLIGFFFWGVEGMGALMDRQRGAAMAEAFDPSTSTQSTPLGIFFMHLSIVIFFTTGGFMIFLSALYESYQIWPVISFLPKPDANYARFFLERVDDFIKMIFLFTAPMLIIMFISELGLGLINRFAPQLNVFFLAMPIKSALGLMVLILYLPFLLPYLKKYLMEYADVLNTLKLIVQ